jgi:hypothetical protein
MLTTGATFHHVWITLIAAAAHVAAAPKPLAGPVAGIVFAVGIVGDGAAERHYRATAEAAHPHPLQ